MDFLSRDRYRQAVEDLADGTGEGQLRVALRTVESARQAAESGVAGRAVHVGHHLIGKGRPDLEADVAYRPRPLRRVRRFVFAHATAVYLGAIGLLTALLLGLGFAYAQRHGDVALAARLGGAAPAAARERRGDRRRPEPVRALRPAAAAPAPRLPGRGAGERADHGRRADAADERREGRGAARAPRGAGARQPRSARPLRDPQRLHGRPRARDAGRRGDPGRRPCRGRGPERPPRRGARRPLLPRPPRAAVEPAAKASGWAGSASAARSRSGTACCAEPRTRASRCRPATPRSSPPSATASPSTPTRACRATPRRS